MKPYAHFQLQISASKSNMAHFCVLQSSFYLVNFPVRDVPQY